MHTALLDITQSHHPLSVLDHDECNPFTEKLTENETHGLNVVTHPEKMMQSKQKHTCMGARRLWKGDPRHFHTDWLVERLFVTALTVHDASYDDAVG